jgi:predicted phage terminase large subunit-like protein
VAAQLEEACPLPPLARIEAALYQRSLHDFVRGAWHIVEPATPFVPGWHLDAICEHLQAVAAGQLRNLLINVPPRHAKSLCVSVFWMCWLWASRPQTRWLYSAYTSSLSTRDSRKCRSVIGSPWYQARWGEQFSLTGDQNAKTRFDNDQTGYRIATGVRGSNTGEGGDIVVVDDPHNVKERDSRKKVEDTLTWWDEVMSTRLNDPRTGAKVIVMQRVAEGDLSGHVLEQGGYEHLCLPAEFEPQRRCTTSLGWSDPRTAEGELLWPQRIGAREVADFKVRLGPLGYAGQFQQRPAPAGGARFKREWFRYFTEDGEFYTLHGLKSESKSVRIDRCDRFGMMDPAVTGASGRGHANSPCYTVIGVWDITPDGEMLKIHHYRDQLEAPDVVKMAEKIYEDFNLPWMGVEKNGIGQGILQTIKSHGLTVKPIGARGSKEARSETAEIRMAVGLIYFKQDAPWLWELQQELLSWPNSENSDQVDELSHAAIWVQKRKGAPGAAGPAAEDADPMSESRTEKGPDVWRDVDVGI